MRNNFNVIMTVQFGDLECININNKHPGIYVIYNLSNAKMYIGSSKNVYKRYKRHSLELENNKHYNTYLQRAYNKTPDMFSFLLLEQINDVNNLISREQYWLDKTQSYNRSIGYNIQIIADSPLGLKRSKKSKLKMRNAQLGKKQSKETILKRTEPLKIPVYQYSLIGEFIAEHKSASDLGVFGLNPNSVSAACSSNNRTKTYNI